MGRPPWSVYGRYNRADALCQTNGYFSLNLREGALWEIHRLMDLKDGDTVGWIGAGDGRELLSLARCHTGVRFDGYEINRAAFDVARRVLREARLENVRLHYQDFASVSPDTVYTHVYSTALSGPELYGRLRLACTRRLCMLDRMWMTRPPNAHDAASVRISGSGERRRLVCAPIHNVSDQSAGSRFLEVESQATE